ncbi:hypothetical protein DPMN_144859 [Dreissena polymorpha]|uniref:Uncharacterized protein n=1 Tax=Dreissena polymorpha TaxID=45954 RepID=A0A9D4IYA1_DREPO|nr:hypothetical protein DPMN_144859 [Dreissena polymorpha]
MQALFSPSLRYCPVGDVSAITRIGTKLLTKFHEDGTRNVAYRLSSGNHVVDGRTDMSKTIYPLFFERKNAPPTGGHVFSPIPTIFKLVRDINKTNVLTNFHNDWAKIVTSRVFTRENCHYIHIEKNAPPTGGHVFSPISTIFELVRDIN